MGKDNRRTRLCCILMAVLFSSLMGSSPVYAEDINENNSEGAVSIGSSDGNKINISYATIFGYMSYDADDPFTNKVADGGQVEIHNASADSNICIYGGLAMNNNSGVSKLGDAKADGNTIHLDSLTLNEGSENGDIIGGVAVSRPNGNTGHVYANRDTVTVNDSNIISQVVTGGYVSRPGASSKHAQVNSNAVEISGSEIISEIYGGNAYVYSAGNSNHYDDNIKEAITEANDNRVVIKDGSIVGREDDLKGIYGSYIYYYSSGNTAEAKGNQVRLNGSTMYGDVFGTYLYSFQCSTGNENSNGTDTVLHAEDNHVYIQDNQILGTVKGA